MSSASTWKDMGRSCTYTHDHVHADVQSHHHTAQRGFLTLSPRGVPESWPQLSPPQSWTSGPKKNQKMNFSVGSRTSFRFSKEGNFWPGDICFGLKHSTKVLLAMETLQLPAKSWAGEVPPQGEQPGLGSVQPGSGLISWPNMGHWMRTGDPPVEQKPCGCTVPSPPHS